MKKTYSLTRYQWTALGILFISTLPFLSAHFLYAFRHMFSLNTVQHGEFLLPPLDSTTLGLPNSTHSGKWQLIYIRSKNGGTHCDEQWQTLKNVHIALGKEQSRVVYHSLTSTQTTSLWQENSIWIVDPRGWVIMHYPPPIKNAKGILEDMRRLLRFSHVG